MEVSFYFVEYESGFCLSFAFIGYFVDTDDTFAFLECSPFEPLKLF